MSHEFTNPEIGPIFNETTGQSFHLHFKQFDKNDLDTIFSSGYFYAVDANFYQIALDELKIDPSVDLRSDSKWIYEDKSLSVGAVRIMRQGWGFELSSFELPSRTGIEIDLIGNRGINIWDGFLPNGTSESHYIRSHLLESFHAAKNELGRFAYEEYQKGKLLPFMELIDGVPELKSIPVHLIVVSREVLAHDVANIMFPEDCGYNIELEESKVNDHSSQLYFTLHILPHDIPVSKWHSGF